MSSMFQGSYNNYINGGQFNINEPGPRSGAPFQLLQGHCALGALLDSNERFDPPRCAEETREAIMKEIIGWTNSADEGASILWLYGSAGAGKSALAQTLGEMFKRSGHLVASFFFSRILTTSAERRDGNRLFTTLAYQLTQAFPETRPYIEAYISKDPAIFDKSRQAHMEQLFVEPASHINNTSGSWLQSLSNAFPTLLKPVLGDLKTRTRLIIIDGLDECSYQDVQLDLLRVIAGAISRLQFPFRILIASRPESSIMHAMNYDPTLLRIRDRVRRIDLDRDEAVHQDIRKFLVKGFQHIRLAHPLREHLDPSWPPQDIIDLLVQKSSTQFIFAATILKYIQSLKHRPDKRLSIILGIIVKPAADRPYAQIDGLYGHIVAGVPEDDRDMVWRLFGILLLSRVHDLRNSRIRTSPSELEKILELEPGQVNLLLDPLLSIIFLPDNRDDSIYFHHASIADYLLDESRSGGLKLEMAFVHEALAKYYFKLISGIPLPATDNRPAKEPGHVNLLADREKPVLQLHKRHQSSPLESPPSNTPQAQAPWTLPRRAFDSPHEPTYLRDVFWFLHHCRRAQLSDELIHPLPKLEFFHNAIHSHHAINGFEHPDKHTDRAILISLMIECIFDICLRTGLEDRLERLAYSCIEMLDKFLLKSHRPSPLDNDMSSKHLQCFEATKHQIYRSLLVPAIASSTKCFGDSIRSCIERTGSFAVPVTSTFQMHMAIIFLPFVSEVPDDTLNNLLAKIKISEDDQVDGLGIHSLNELYSSILTSYQSRVRGGMKPNSQIIDSFLDPIGNPDMECKEFAPRWISPHYPSLAPGSTSSSTSSPINILR